MSLPAVASSPDDDDEGKAISRKRAEALSKSKLVPEHFANDPASVQYVGEIARYLKIDPVSALAQIHVYPGKGGRLKASLSADLMVSLARREGHVVHVKGNMAGAQAKLVRKEALDPEVVENFNRIGLDVKDYYIFETSWSEERVKQMKLAETKENWRLYRPEMMCSRVKTGIVHLGCPEVIMDLKNALAESGLVLDEDSDEAIAISMAHHTPDELGEETSAEGVPVNKVKVESAPNLTSSMPDFSEVIGSRDNQGVIDYIREDIAGNEDLTDETKLTWLHQFYKAWGESNRSDPSDEVKKAIGGAAQPLLPKK